MQSAASARDRLTIEEATARAGRLCNVTYAIDLDLQAGAKAFRGDVTITFDSRGGDTFLEWVGGRIDRFEINGVEAEPAWDGARIALSGAALSARNEIRISYERSYDHTGEGFHQFVDPEDGAEYLYTQFEPYSAHRLFPCFDQPDLKAVFRVSVTAPEEWEVVSAGAEIEREGLPDGRSRRVFAETAPFSTYLLAVCAGPFAAVRHQHRGISLGLFCRASLLPHLDAEPLFAVTGAGIDFYEELFAQPYPFGKYDQLFVPEFNWGGMENVAAVTYTDSVVFRDPPTQDQLTRRAEYLTHELAHMWFGDLVTMRWWSDLWLNESFASYVAYLALDSMGGYPGIWQDFNTRMKLWAYREDQRPTTHRIADDIPSTDETFLNFDGITYGKGAAALKQLVAAIGMDAFRDGMRTYFRRHRFGNATLADFLGALQEGVDIDLVAWAARWLKTPSLNTVSADWEVKEGRLSRLGLVQSAPAEHPTLRPHRLEVALLDADGGLKVIPAFIDGPERTIDVGSDLPAPVFVYPNHGDHAYAKVALDPASTLWARENLARISDPLLRQQVWGSLWEMVRDRQLSSIDYLSLVGRALPLERDLGIVDMVTGTVAGTVSRYVSEERVDAEAHRFVLSARAAIDAAPPGDLRVLWGRALIGQSGSPEDARLAAALLDVPPDGFAVDQEMRWAVAVLWSALGLEGAADRIVSERVRDQSDRGDRAVLAAEVARPDPASKEEAWERIHNNGYGSLHLAMAAGRGFWQRSQGGMLEPYVGRFFESLPGLFAEWEAEASRAYFRTVFPWHHISHRTRTRVSAVLERGDLGPMLVRLLIEAGDDLDRALACREFAAATAG
jgi:aminopeptidase N